MMRSALVVVGVAALASSSSAAHPSFSSSTASASPRGGLEQIEHVIIFQQENRAYDHVYGTLGGVRGFNDRTAIPVPSGLSSFYQPTDAFNITGPYMLPFHVNTMSTSAICMDAPAMDYPTDIGMWNGGRYDAWDTFRAPGMGMAHFNRSDLPYYYALYDEFTTGDQYFQSTFTQTNPNRLHLFSGSNGLSVGKMAVLDNSEPTPGWTWPTMGEILEEAGVSWKV
jgi:phospholipase C